MYNEKQKKIFDFFLNQKLANNVIFAVVKIV